MLSNSVSSSMGTSAPVAMAIRRIERDRILWRIIAAAALAYLAVKMVLLVVTTLNAQYLMDEFAVVHEAGRIDGGLYQDMWPHRTALAALLYQIAFVAGDSAVEVMRWARLEAVALSLASLAVIYAIARSLGRRRSEAVFALCIVLAVSSFMERAFMARPEAPMLFFGACALWALTAAPGRLSAVLVAGVLAGTAFLTSQKAVYLDLALGLAVVGERLAAGRPGQALAAGGVLVAGWAIAVAAYVGYFALHGTDAMTLARWIFLGPPTDNAVQGHQVYEDLSYYVWQTLLRNPGVYLLCALGWLAAVITVARRSPAERIALIFTTVVAVSFYGVHPAPWPYNFILVIPFLGLWAPYLIEPLRPAPLRLQVVAGAVVLAILTSSFARNVHYLAFDNVAQVETIETAESLLAPNERYFDGTHMIVTRPLAAPFWLQRGELLRILDNAARGDTSLVDEIFGQPKVVIESYRTDTIEEVLAPYLRHSYVRVAPNVLLSGTALPSEAASDFVVQWEGVYRLRDVDGRPSDAALTVNGTTLSGAIRLKRGRYAVRLVEPSAEPLYLLPANAAIAIPAAPIVNRPLFANAHLF